MPERSKTKLLKSKEEPKDILVMAFRALICLACLVVGASMWESFMEVLNHMAHHEPQSVSNLITDTMEIAIVAPLVGFGLYMVKGIVNSE